ncbi:DUF4360 domain-containing protein [Oligoflexus tunisiensis]|uniref:DUF4360 domain-containing protein n=1 Tax=Oligoflexus tunisiensis TaxID=708132 RepID=UPI00114CEF87|nr:DUF4360 domain-containing protein [Oligoflexus tunisiensis]
MRMPYFLIGSCLLSLTAPTEGQEMVPDYFEITDVIFNGDGCPPGSVDKNVAADRLSFSLIFRNYIAEAAPHLSPSDGRRACQVTVNLRVPPGWRFAVAGFDYAGYMNLDEGIHAEHKTSYYYQATDKQGEFTNTKKGPQQNPFHFQQDVKLHDKLWSSCETKRALNIKTAIRVWNNDRTRYPNAAGVMGADSLIGDFHDQKWKLSWARCP